MPQFCIIPDHRPIMQTLQPGGVRAPTYGIVIKNQIRQLVVATGIRMTCLQGTDFYNVLWTNRGIRGEDIKDITPHGWRSWLGFASHEDQFVCLNSSGLRNETQSVVDFVCLHEIAHLLLDTDEEEDADLGACDLARRLLIRLDMEFNNSGRIKWPPQRKRKR